MSYKPKVKGTVSRDGLELCWHACINLSLNMGRGRISNFQMLLFPGKKIFLFFLAWDWVTRWMGFLFTCIRSHPQTFILAHPNSPPPSRFHQDRDTYIYCMYRTYRKIAISDIRGFSRTTSPSSILHTVRGGPPSSFLLAITMTAKVVFDIHNTR